MEYNNTPSTFSLDQLLRDTMTVSPSAVSTQNQLILDTIQNLESQTTVVPKQTTCAIKTKDSTVFSSLWSRLRILAPVPVLCFVFVIVCTITVYAAIRILSAAEAVDETHYYTLADAFRHEDAIEINETQTSGKYDITLLGITFGSAISEVSGHNYPAGDAFAVVAISYADGTPLPDISDDRWLEEVPDFYVTFLANGYSVMDNPLDRRSSISFFTREGVVYYLKPCENLSDYTDTGIYFAVNEGISCTGFVYDETSHQILQQENTNQVQALFPLSIRNPLPDHSDNLETSVAQTVPGTPDTTTPNTEVGIRDTLWTTTDLERLNTLTIQGKLLYVTEDKILTMEAAPSGSTEPSLFHLYDYSGKELDTKSLVHAGLTGYHREPLCTASGFVIQQGSELQIYDYDFSLRYTLDLSEIPSEYPAIETMAITDGQTAVVSVYEDFTGGVFSSSLDYYTCQILVYDDEQCVEEGWLYDAHTGQWSMLYHGEISQETYDSIRIQQVTPMDHKDLGLFTCQYTQNSIDGIPDVSHDGYGLLSLTTGEILGLWDGQVDLVSETDDGTIFLYLSQLQNGEEDFLLLAPDTLTVTSLNIDTDDAEYFCRISPDGRWILIYEEQWEPHKYPCRIYDKETGTFSKTIEVSLDEGKRAVVEAFPGGFMLKRWDESQRLFFSYGFDTTPETDAPTNHTVSGELPAITVSKIPWTTEQVDILNNTAFEGRVWHITDDFIVTIDRETNSSEKLIDFTVRIYNMDGSLLRQKRMKTENRWPWHSWNTYTDTGFVVAADNVYQIYDYDFRLIGTVDPSAIPTNHSFDPLISKGSTTDASGKKNDFEIEYSFPRAFTSSFSSNLKYFIVTILVNPTEHTQRSECWLYDISGDTWTKLFFDRPKSEEFDCFTMYYMVPSDDGKTAAFTASYLRERVPGTSQMQDPCYGLFSLENKKIVMYRDGKVNKIHSLGNTFCMTACDETTPILTRWYSILDPATNTEYRTKAVESQTFESAMVSPDGNYVMFSQSITDSDPAKRCRLCRMFDISSCKFSESFSLPLSGDILLDEYGYVIVPSLYDNEGHIFGTYP